MNRPFDKEEAKEFLSKRKHEKKENLEKVRQSLLETTLSFLRKEFARQDVEVYLVGSIIRPYAFGPASDIDIVVKNFKGDRFSLWPKLEELLNRRVELILYENYSFQEDIHKYGLKVV